MGVHGVRGCAWVCAGVCKCTYMYVGGCGCEWVGAGVCGMHGCVWKCAEVRRCLRVCVFDEFSEYLLETRFNTSADFNTYPMRIFLFCSYSSLSLLFFFSFTSSLLHLFYIISSSSKYLLVTPLVLKSYRRPCSYVVQCILL